MEFRVLGPVEVRDGDARVQLGGPKRRALLAVMLLNANRVVAVDRLIGTVWGEAPPATAPAQVQAAVSALRKALGNGGLDGERIVTRPPGYLVRLQPGELDLQLFERDAGVARQALAEGNVERAATGLRAALDWWHGAALSDLVDSPLRTLAVGLEERRMAALEERIDADLALGRHAMLIPELTGLIADHPLREGFRGQLMVALYRTGRQAEALGAYRATRQTLVDELGLEPGPELQRLEQAILSADPALDFGPPARRRALDAGADATPRPPCPYRGLSAFGVTDSGVFFGRRTEITEVVERVHGAGPVTVVGPSGCGKSSLIFAGVLPELVRGAMPAPAVVIFRPSYARNLYAGLAAALMPALAPDLTESEQIDQMPKLADELEATGLGEAVPRVLDHAGATQLVLVIDQAEELFAQHPDQLDRFAEHVFGRDAPAALKVVSTLRADFLTAALRRPALTAALRQSIYTLGAMTVEQLREVVTEPLEGTGVEFQPGLADRILADVGTDPGGLPLLGLTLTLLWERQIDGQLTHEAYDALGRVSGSLARYAEEEWRRSNLDNEEATARQLFTQLILVTPSGEVTRRVASRQDLGGPRWALAQRLATSRLLVTGRNAEGHETVELAHEALVRNWARLGPWIEADREFRQWQESLRADLIRWERASRDPHLLSRGSSLTAAQQWSSERPDDLAPAETEFIDHSRRQHRGGIRRRQLVLSGLALGVIMTLVLGGLFIYQRDRTGRESAASTSRALAVASAEWVSRDPVHAARLALAAYQVQPTAEAISALFRPYLDTQAVTTMFSSQQGGLGHVVASRDGRVVAASTAGENVTVWSRIPGKEPRAVQTLELSNQSRGLALTQDGRSLWFVDDGWLCRFDVAGGRLHKVTKFGGSEGQFIAVSADGGTVYLVTGLGFGVENQKALVWDVASRRGSEHALPKGRLTAITPSADGKSLVVEIPVSNPTSFAYTVELWGLADGSRRVVVDPANGVRVTPADVAVSCNPIDKRSRRFTAVRISTGQVMAQADLTSSPVCVEYATDASGMTVVTKDEGALAEVLDLRSGKVTSLLRAPVMEDLRMLPVLAGTGDELDLVMYDKTRIALLEVPHPGDGLPHLMRLGVRADGKSLMGVAEDGSELRNYPLNGGAPLAMASRPAPHWRPTGASTGSYDGKLLADRIAADRVAVRRFPSLELVREITTPAIPPKDRAAPGDTNTALFFDESGRLIVGVGHRVEMWDPISGRRLADLDLDQLGHTRKGQVAWLGPHSEPGKLGLIVDGQPDVQVIDIMTGRIVLTIPVGVVVNAIFQDRGSPYLLIIRSGDPVEVWDWRKKRRVNGPIAAAEEGRLIATLEQRGEFVISDRGQYTIWRVGSATPQLSLRLGGTLQVGNSSADGRTVTVHDGLGLVAVLRLDPAVWRKHICSVIGRRGLTDKELSGLPASTPRRSVCPS